MNMIEVCLQYLRWSYASFVSDKKSFFKGPTASLGDFQNPCFLGGNSRKVHENFLEKKKSPLHP